MAKEPTKNEFQIKYGTENLDWNEINLLFQKAPLGERPPEMFKKACEYTPVVVTAWDSERLIGFGRAFTNFVGYASIYDVVVLPKYQNMGVGTLIMSAILEKVEVCGSVILFANPGKEGFYKKIGFKKMKTAMGKFKNEGKAIERGVIE